MRLVLLLGALWPGDALACAVCLSLTKHDMGFLWSALFLMGLPIAMAGLIGGWLYYSYRRSTGRGRAGYSRLIVTEKESGQ
ncbi:MAG: hypothetical protein A3I03_15315 [Candidatus Rokubacteria bacterium RIFCSPLOWO2_02_FULL_68_19]|nr:MAG: hypothetical protein A3I03_15315 [Candidatus Rokubacteria bacterium RIFCSPLOWO2_02_FULL_68_19]